MPLFYLVVALCLVVAALAAVSVEAAAWAFIVGFVALTIGTVVALAVQVRRAEG